MENKIKRYIVNEHQLGAIHESVVTETPNTFIKGDRIELLTPVDGFNVPPKSEGMVIHVDALGTLRTEFNINGQLLVIPINPDVDNIVKKEMV